MPALQNWRAARITPARAAPPHRPLGVLAEVRRTYINADFSTCLSQLQRPELQFERLLRDGMHTAATERNVLAAACFYGSQQERQARRMLRSIYAKDLGARRALANMPADLRALAAEERTQANALSRQPLTIRSRPPAGRVVIDGGVSGCPHAPCTVELLPGRHVVVVQLPAYADATQTVVLAEGIGREITLDLARLAAEQAKPRLAMLLASDAKSTKATLGRLASHAFSAEVVLLVRRVGSKVQGFVYDAPSDQVTSTGLSNVLPTGNAGAEVVASLLRLTSPSPQAQPSASFWGRPLPWIVAGGVAAAAVAGIVVYALTSSSSEPRYDVTFR